MKQRVAGARNTGEFASMTEQAVGWTVDEACQQRATLARTLTILRLGLELLDDAERSPLAHDLHRTTLTQVLRLAVDRATAAVAPGPPRGDPEHPIA
jgi:hypothetical protein